MKVVVVVVVFFETTELNISSGKYARFVGI
jgi:hypothetical protein